jgi:predicted DCC family thiol-disulfide oxidoreductase YuxK
VTHPWPVLLYDGTCGFCGATVQFLLKRDRRRTLRFAALDGPAAARILERHPELTGVDSVAWVEPAGPRGPESVAIRSEAVIRAGRYLGGAWRLAGITRVLPRRSRDRVYDWIARHRHRLPGRNRCVVPPPEARERFLDQ